MPDHFQRLERMYLSAPVNELWETGRLAAEEEARFHTRSGVLKAKRRGDGIELDLPAEAPEPVSAPP